MSSGEAPRRIREEISIQQVGTETLVYDGRRHRAYCLNQSSSTIWRLADGVRSLSQLRAAASVALQTEVSTEFVLLALEDLREEGLLEAACTAPSISRRALLQRLGVGGTLLLPAIASIVAPTAAQAYNGCVDCSDANTDAVRAARARRIEQANQSRSSSTPGGNPEK